MRTRAGYNIGGGCSTCAENTGILVVRGVLTCCLQGPRAKIMLYPYYATMIATSSGMFNSSI